VSERIEVAQFHAVYELGKQVERKELGFSAAANILSEKHGMKLSSAMSYLGTLQCILAGREYQRTVNLAATRYFLERIRDDFDQTGLHRALSACKQHLRYYGRKGRSKLPSLRALVAEFGSTLGAEGQEAQSEDFYDQVRRSIADGHASRQRRLEKALAFPEFEFRTTRFFARNPDVAAEVLVRANGVCERCNCEAPFVRSKDGSPYLEVHHTGRLADGGEDTVQNAMALCPNCHRELHFGMLS
jgi:5-methylcytosine-specific restriction protein A